MMWVWIAIAALVGFVLGVLSSRATFREDEETKEQERQRLKREKEETVELCECLADVEGNRVWFCQTADGHRFRWAKLDGEENSWWSDDEGWRVREGTALRRALLHAVNAARLSGNDHWVRHTERGEP